MDNLFDVVIVGAGPAGSNAAYYLAKEGFSVALLDKEKFPRKKPCGDGFPIGASETLDCKIPERIIGRKIHGVNLISPREEIYFLYRPRTLGYTITRENLDAFLLQRAMNQGAEFFGGEKVSKVTVSKINGIDSGLVETREGNSFMGKIIIGADGNKGIVGRSVGLVKPRKPGEKVIAIRGYIHESKLGMPLEDFMIQPNQIEIYYAINQNGYDWIFPLKDRINIGTGYFPPRQMSIKRALEMFVKYAFELRGIKLKKQQRLEIIRDLQGSEIFLGGTVDKIALKNVLLVGEAAGLVDPLSGDGVHWALLSGKVAAEKITQAVDAKKPSALADDYQETMMELVMTNMAFARKNLERILAKLLLLFDAVKFNPELMEYFEGLATNEKDYLKINSELTFPRKVIIALRIALGRLGLIRPSQEIFISNIKQYFEQKLGGTRIMTNH